MGIQEKSPYENNLPFGFTVSIWGSDPYGKGEGDETFPIWGLPIAIRCL
jgi:hypothetical protein